MWKVPLVVFHIGLLALLLLGGTVLLHKQEPVIDRQPAANNEQQITEEISISISPATILQGEPVKITVNGLSSTSTIESLTFNGKPLPLLLHENRPATLIGIDLRGRVGSYPIVLTFRDGNKIEKELVVNERVIAKAPLGIPEELGGNTPQAERELINTLVQEGALISAVPTENRMLWSGEFAWPLKGELTITDVYGYSRLTGDSTISHKGTDFRAAVGTPVYAMNSGNVVFARHLRNYGNTIIIDHGLGLHTIYMHLSEINAELDKMVTKGELIARSGDTGYVFGPHLHLTIRISGISIDPMRFMELLGPKP